MLSGSVGGTWYRGDDVPGSTGASSRWAVWAEPSFVYFIRDRIGLGGYVGYESNHGDFVEQQVRWAENRISAGVSGSFEVVASGSWGLFLNVNFGYAWSQRNDRFGRDAGAVNYYDSDRLVEHDRRVQLGFHLPLTYLVSSSVGIGLGPDVLLEFQTYQGHTEDSSTRVRLGGSSWIAYSF
jgi:hypothetical protein